MFTRSCAQNPASDDITMHSRAIDLYCTFYYLIFINTDLLSATEPSSCTNTWILSSATSSTEHKIINTRKLLPNITTRISTRTTSTTRATSLLHQTAIQDLQIHTPTHHFHIYIVYHHKNPKDRSLFCQPVFLRLLTHV